FLLARGAGARAAGDELVGGLARLGTPPSSQIGLTEYEDLLATLDVFGGRGRHWALRTRSLSRLTDEAEAVLLEAGNALTSQVSAISVHHFHGAAARVPVEDTAFGLREKHLMVELIAGWEPSANDDGARHRSWADHAAQALGPHALSGGYPNLLGPDEHGRALAAFGPNLPRLLTLKHRFDPDN